MEATHGHSASCCNIPPIVSKGYEEKGTYQTIGGIKTYVTGPASASKGIVFIYDIFGYFPQTIQGADILATSDKDNAYKVFMPDLLGGNPIDISVFPPDTKEKQETLSNFFSGRGAPPKVASEVIEYQKAIAAENTSIKKWASLGLCWGGKIVSLTSQSGTPFSAAAECHPAMVDASEAKGISIPLCMLASKDEPADDVKKFEATLTGPKHVEIFGDQIHGWMGARADLEEKRVQQEYERGYKTLLEFYGKYL